VAVSDAWVPVDTVTATATPSAATPAAALAPQRAEPKAHKLWLAAYVAVLLGKFADWVPGLGGLPVAKVAILMAMIFAWRARATLPAVRVRSLPIARVALPFLALAFASILFSAYISMSVATVYVVIVLMISFVLLLKITETVRDVERLLLALCVAAAGLAVAAVFSYGGGRASISENIDSNDLAYGLVTVLPISRALAVTRKKMGRLILNGLSVILLLAILLTGSRGGALGLGTVILLLAAFPLKFAKTGGLKVFRLGRFVAVLGLISVLGTGLWSYLPAETRERMATLLDLGNDYNAGSSTASRSAIWIRNSKAVWNRPIGYGLGTSEYVDGLTGGAYRALHNSFVEAFVELGFLGLLLFCTSYFVTLRQLGRVSGLTLGPTPNAEAAKAALYARALRIALAGNFVSGFFLSDAYSEVLWTVIAISAALVRIGLLASEGPATAQEEPGR
jgi:O-Antigen ligase